MKSSPLSPHPGTEETEDTELVGRPLVLEIVCCENLPITREDGSEPDVMIVIRVVSSTRGLRSHTEIFQSARATRNPDLRKVREIVSLCKEGFEHDGFEIKGLEVRNKRHGIRRSRLHPDGTKRFGWRANASSKDLEENDTSPSHKKKNISIVKVPLVVEAQDCLEIEIFDRHERDKHIGRKRKPPELIMIGRLDLSESHLGNGGRVNVSLHRPSKSLEAERTHRKRRSSSTNVVNLSLAFESLHRRFAPDQYSNDDDDGDEEEKEDGGEEDEEEQQDEKKNKNPSQIVLRFPRFKEQQRKENKIKSVPPPPPRRETKTVWFIRHGQSIWNQAQKNWNPFAMLGHYDHGLSEDGAMEAARLWKRICDTPQHIGETLGVSVCLSTMSLETCLK